MHEMFQDMHEMAQDMHGIVYIKYVWKGFFKIWMKWFIQDMSEMV